MTEEQREQRLSNAVEAELSAQKALTQARQDAERQLKGLSDSTAGLPQELADIGFEEVRVVRLEPGDVVVLMTSKRLSADQAEFMREQAQAFFDGHRVAVLEDGVSLEVVREGGEL